MPPPQLGELATIRGLPAPGRLSQKGDVEISVTRRTCAFVRSHAWRLNPLARGVLLRIEPNVLVRQACAPMRSSRSGCVPSTLTALDSSQSTVLRYENQQRTSTTTATGIQNQLQNAAMLSIRTSFPLDSPAQQTGLFLHKTRINPLGYP